MFVGIFTTVPEFQNGNIYFLMFDTDASCQRYETKYGAITTPDSFW
jgi:hypothetical protein